MKTILMMHYDLHFYRVPIYEKLFYRLGKRGIRLIIWPIKVSQQDLEMNFQIINKKMNIKNFQEVISSYKVDGIINFLNPSKPSYMFYIVFLLLAKIKKIDLFYYGHGLNLESNSKFLKLFYNLFHFLYKKIILYTPNEKVHLWEIHRKKIEIAYNTLDLEGRDLLITDSRQKLRSIYGYKEELIVLFSGRIEQRKKLEVLLDIFEEYENDSKNNIRLLIVGPTNDEEIIRRMKNNEFTNYLGPIYDKKKIAELFYISDLFCIPGHIGLGLIEAMYWGLPVITLNVKHAPEIYYLVSNKNGFLLENKNELSEKFQSIEKDKDLLNNMSSYAKMTYQEKASVEKMLKGFINALD
ncbi:MAG TPA: glycosyltransferase [Arcobacter sp.]|nr:glycosyltransferase [Arcobacter sp.]